MVLSELRALRHRQLPADFLRQFVGNLGMSGDSFCVAGGRIHPEGVGAALALEVAPMPPEVFKQSLAHDRHCL